MSEYVREMQLLVIRGYIYEALFGCSSSLQFVATVCSATTVGGIAKDYAATVSEDVQECLRQGVLQWP